MNNDDNLDLLDLNDDDVDAGDNLPDAAPLTAPRAKKPWLLLGVGVLIIILATYVIIRIVGGDSSSTMTVDLDAPAVIVDGADPNAPLVVPTPAPQPAQPQQPALTKKPTPSSVSQNQTKAENPVRPAASTVTTQPKPSTNTRYATVSSRSGATTRPQQSTPRKRVLMPGQNRGLRTR